MRLVHSVDVYVAQLVVAHDGNVRKQRRHERREDANQKG
jgi:hypothetical protein